MAENTKKAQCTQEEFDMARAAGLFIATSADEKAVHDFAEAVRAQTRRMPELTIRRDADHAERAMRKDAELAA